MPENADKPANCKIYVETSPDATQKILLSFARLMIVSFRADKKLVVSKHKLQKNVSENADKPANCKIYVETSPEATQKNAFPLQGS